MNGHKQLMSYCYDIATNAQENGNHPFGALLAKGTKIMMTAENTVISSGDITRHAELNLISKATQRWSHKQMNEMTLYSSTEPCAMCSGAIFWSGISSVVFGCSVQTMAKFTTGSFIVPCHHVFDYGNRQINVIGPVLEEVGASIHRGYWQ